VARADGQPAVHDADAPAGHHPQIAQVTDALEPDPAGQAAHLIERKGHQVRPVVRLEIDGRPVNGRDGAMQVAEPGAQALVDARGSDRDRAERRTQVLLLG
jgi:hypothetical protein